MKLNARGKDIKESYTGIFNMQYLISNSRERATVLTRWRESRAEVSGFFILIVPYFQRGVWGSIEIIRPVQESKSQDEAECAG